MPGEIPYQRFIKDDGYWSGEEIASICCPRCGSPNQHVKEPIRQLSGRDEYQAGWMGRGNLVTVPFWGECGSAWELCLGFHKGQTGIFARMISECGQPAQ